MGPIAIRLFQCGHDELAFHLTHRLAGLKARRLGDVDALVEKIGGRDPQAATESKGSVNDVLELANVARPSITLKQLQSIVIH